MEFQSQQKLIHTHPNIFWRSNCPLWLEDALHHLLIMMYLVLWRCALNSVWFEKVHRPFHLGFIMQCVFWSFSVGWVSHKLCATWNLWAEYVCVMELVLDRCALELIVILFILAQVPHCSALHMLVQPCLKLANLAFLLCLTFLSLFQLTHWLAVSSALCKVICS